MGFEADRSNSHLFGRWILANFLGWLLGFVFIFLGLVFASLMGVERAQFYFGIAMGAGIGYAQVRAVGRQLSLGNWWGWASVVGMGAPFVVSDIVRAVWSGLPYLLSLSLSVACGGLLVGLLQRRLLRLHSTRSNWWVPASVAAWTLAAATVYFYGAVPGVSGSGTWSALINLAAILLGGPILGAVTGGTLLWMLRYRPAAL
jgi:hypothetical protein